MKALVIYESMFGNTERIAQAIAEGLESAGATVTLLPVQKAPVDSLPDYDVVVAGAPTHAWSLPRPSTREEAARQGATPPAGPGLREWIESLTPEIGARPAFAVFDSRLGVGTARRFSGSAARRAARALRARRRTLTDAPASFYVESSTGPLMPGEETRARAWGSTLAQHLPVP